MTGHERDRLAAWIDGELTPAEREEVQTHLASCEECAALLAEMEGVDALARTVSVDAPSGYFETLPGRVRARIEGAPRPRATRSPSPARWRLPLWTWAAAAVLLLAVVAPLTLDRLDVDAPLLPREAAAPAPGATPRPAEARRARGREPATAAGRAQDRAQRAKEEGAGPGRRDAEGDRGPFAASPAPEAGAVLSETPRPESGDVPAAPPPVEGRAVAGEAEAEMSAPPVERALEETMSASTPLVRRQGAADDRASREAPAPVTAAAPAKRRAASSQASGRQEGRAATEKKALADDSRAFARLAQARPSGAAAWREHREAWRAFVSAYPRSRHADEARVRIVEAGLEAWRSGGDPEDLARAREDARAYLAREDARQQERVRRALAGVEGG